eukprot:Awhi_evm1s8884
MKVLRLLKEKRHILILSDRREHLQILSEMIEYYNRHKERRKISYGFYVGGMKPKELK